MSPAITIRDLGKRYRVNHAVERASYRTLRDSLARTATAPLRRLRSNTNRASEDFWAIKDVEFDVEPGEVVGIIGRNGAGKSTLLKILSRITTPTTGTVAINGRVGSLLEVGTGFHPELTGRENIFMNGSVLGMTRRDIASKFDEIVGFADIERFLDTPVKRYSSGMYVRLAFAVAAHLDPDILLVDEVLAVGDVKFQSKCLKRMETVSRGGRTVIFVSHNLASVRALCRRVVLLESGRLVSQGDTEEQLSRYLADLRARATQPLIARSDRIGTGEAKITYMEFRDDRGRTIAHGLPGRRLDIAVGYQLLVPDAAVTLCALSVFGGDGTKLFHVDSGTRGTPLRQSGSRGEIVCSLSKLPLVPGAYHVDVLIAVNGRVADHVVSAAHIEISPGDYYGVGKVTEAAGGSVFVDHEWDLLCKQ